ncbi:MAG: hypothetical protein A2Y23_09820 [Clostridiales bacterium GWB2_37_7]|nr:MAG: hypothetical protein A2Y23_09820 [Clostridiales bacterium GWB2_37_7]
MERKIVKTPLLKMISWASIVFFFFCTIGSFYFNQEYVSIVFILFMILGVLGVLISGKAEITSNGFLVLLPIGKYYISWEEVEYIETGSGNLVLGNKTKRICFPSFEFWSRSEKEEAVDLVFQILKRKGLQIQETKRAILPLYKNTKVN